MTAVASPDDVAEACLDELAESLLDQPDVSRSPDDGAFHPSVVRIELSVGAMSLVSRAARFAAPPGRPP